MTKVEYTTSAVIDHRDVRSQTVNSLCKSLYESVLESIARRNQHNAGHQYPRSDAHRSGPPETIGNQTCKPIPSLVIQFTHHPTIPLNMFNIASDKEIFFFNTHYS